MVVCNEEHRFVIAEQLRLMGRPGKPSCWSPRPQHGAGLHPGRPVRHRGRCRPCAARDAGRPRDHRTAGFRAVVARGAELPQGDRIVTFGITPDTPETGYGYIQAGAVLTAGDSPRRIARFVEKPDLATAEVLPRRRFLPYGTAACS